MSTENLNFKLQSEQKPPLLTQIHPLGKCFTYIAAFCFWVFLHNSAPWNWISLMSWLAPVPSRNLPSRRRVRRENEKHNFQGFPQNAHRCLSARFYNPVVSTKEMEKVPSNALRERIPGPSVVVFAFPIKRFTFIASARKRKTRGIYVLAEAVSGDGAAYLISAAPPIALNPEAFE